MGEDEEYLRSLRGVSDFDAWQSVKKVVKTLEKMTVAVPSKIFDTVYL